MPPAAVRPWTKYRWMETGSDRHALALNDNRSLEISKDTGGDWMVCTYRSGIRRIECSSPTLRMAIEEAGKLVPSAGVRPLRDAAAGFEEPPTLQQCGYLYMLNRNELSRTHADAQKFWNFCMSEFQAGNEKYSKRGVTDTIDAIKRAPPLWRVRKIAEYKAQQQVRVAERKAKRDAELALIARATGETRDRADDLKRSITPSPECPYCAKPLPKERHLDHIYPVSLGGLSIATNMVWVCVSCNITKSNRTLNGFIERAGLDRDAVYARLKRLGKQY